jgi:cytoskeletal protein CcmA (bactofilin family)
MWFEKEKEKKPLPVGPARKPAADPAPAPERVVKAPPPVAPIIPNPRSEGTENPMTDNILKNSPSGASSTRQTLLGSSMVLKGELSGEEDLTIEGQFDGTINLKDSCLTIGSHGQVKADITARQVIVSGKLSGKINARDKIEIRKTGNVVGDLVAMGVAIEEGAYFKGSIEILREEEKPSHARAAATTTTWTA